MCNHAFHVAINIKKKGKRGREYYYDFIIIVTAPFVYSQFQVLAGVSIKLQSALGFKDIFSRKCF